MYRIPQEILSIPYNSILMLYYLH